MLAWFTVKTATATRRLVSRAMVFASENSVRLVLRVLWPVAVLYVLHHTSWSCSTPAACMPPLMATLGSSVVQPWCDVMVVCSFHGVETLCASRTVLGGTLARCMNETSHWHPVLHCIYSSMDVSTKHVTCYHNHSQWAVINKLDNTHGVQTSFEDERNFPLNSAYVIRVHRTLRYSYSDQVQSVTSVQFVIELELWSIKRRGKVAAYSFKNPLNGFRIQISPKIQSIITCVNAYLSLKCEDWSATIDESC